jgi:two-component system phosphate regulon sensor histidine kinase PhoR
MALFGRAAGVADAVRTLRRVLDAHESPPPELQEFIAYVGDSRAEIATEQRLIDALHYPAGILAVDGRIRSTNAPLDRLLGAGRTIGRSLLEGTRSEELSRLGERALRGESVKAEIEVHSIQRTLLACGAPFGREALLTLRDLTDEKRAYLARRDFVANASHELRTPVSAIAAAAETLKSLGGALTADAREFVDVIGRHGERLARLTNALLDLSKLESGQTRLEAVRIRAAELCGTALQLVAPAAAAKGVALVSDVPESLAIRADRRASEQILLNYLDNAVKHTPQGGRVTLLADTAKDGVIFAVIDSGPGIEARHLPRLFERFYRVDPGRARGDGGAGLGLSIAQALALAQGGAVGVESGAGGSRFWVRLPAG